MFDILLAHETLSTCTYIIAKSYSRKRNLIHFYEDETDSPGVNDCRR